MNCQATRDIDWDSLVVPDDAAFVHLVDGEGTRITLSPGPNNRLPSVYDDDGGRFERYAIEFADGEVRWRSDRIDVDLPEWASGKEDNNDGA